VTTFHVFLSHNSKDKPSIRELKTVLTGAGLTCWLDEDQLIPGENWQPLLEAGIDHSQAAAVCFGPAGIGPWQDEEMQALLIKAVKSKMRVIPVLLPGAPAQPELPLFLIDRTWVDLRQGYSEASIKRLIWGITGSKPEESGIVPVPQGPVPSRSLASAGHFSGKTRLAFCDRLGSDWQRLAVLLGISPADQARFERGDEARSIWVWLDNRKRLGELIAALDDIGRSDLAELLRSES
jgi:hypothetical protein